MLAIVTPAEMRAIDASANQTVEALVELAGRHLARRARSILGGVYGRRVNIIAGPGNNGADGRVCGAILAAWGVRVAFIEPGIERVDRCDLVIDAAFGTGISGPWRPPALPGGVPVLAVDTPSGVDGLTGAITGGAITASSTVTFGALKPGLLLHPGAGFTGDIEIAGLGLDTGSATSWLFTESDAAAWLPWPDPTTHKWRRSVRVVGGSPGMTGAPMLASTAALRAGAGYAHCVLGGGRRATAVSYTAMSEVVFSSDTDWPRVAVAGLDRFGALAIGPGLGRSADTAAGLSHVLAAAVGAKPVVVDGDALHLLGATTLAPSTVVTPHDGEYVALTGARPGPDRFAAARHLARITGATALLKGPITVIAAPDGRAVAVRRGDSRLATAGSGDVLTGVIASLLAADVEPLYAAALGAWLHGDAGRLCRPVGMIATDLLDALAQSVSMHTQRQVGAVAPH